MASVLRHFATDDLLVVVSAMGKTTNALEAVVWAYATGATRRSDGSSTSFALEVLAKWRLMMWRPRRSWCSFDKLNAYLKGKPSGRVDRTTIRSCPTASVEHLDRERSPEAPGLAKYLARCTDDRAHGCQLSRSESGMAGLREPWRTAT
jgi:hypothetical protein